ncbi:MAG: FecR family protein, partial [Thermoanaerobaculia bacterium]
MHDTQRDVDTLLERAAAQIRDSGPEERQVEEAAARVWNHLTSDVAQVAAIAAEVEEIRGCDDYQALIPAYMSSALPEARRILLEDHSRECVPCRRALKTAREGKPARAPMARSRRAAKVVPFPHMKWALAAAAVLAGVLLAPALLDMLGPSGPSATVATIDGALFRVAESSHLPIAVGETIHEGEIIRGGREGGSVIELRDGSLVELRARSEISIDESRRGTTIALERGSVIIQAAEQRSRHLYVATEECLVSVTGTIFSVNHGTKGSRVSVIEGEVRVNYSGDEAVLYPGEQLVTSDYLSQVPFDAEIGWSRDLDQYLGLLAEYSQLRRDIHNAVPRPGLRYSSRLLDLMPEGTMFYAALPNLGETVTETRRVLRERLDQSPVLAEWWRAQGYEQFEPMADEIVARLGEFSDHLGEELAIGGQLRSQSGSDDDFAGPLVLAEVVDGAGLRDFVEQQLADLAEEHGEEVDVVFLDDPFAPTVGVGDDDFFLWIHSDL